jgi:hypothetical protein
MEKDLQKLKVPELQKLLKDAKLDAKGTKPELVAVKLLAFYLSRVTRMLWRATQSLQWLHHARRACQRICDPSKVSESDTMREYASWTHLSQSCFPSKGPWRCICNEQQEDLLSKHGYTGQERRTCTFVLPQVANCPRVSLQRLVEAGIKADGSKASDTTPGEAGTLQCVSTLYEHILRTFIPQTQIMRAGYSCIFAHTNAQGTPLKKKKQAIFPNAAGLQSGSAGSAAVAPAAAQPAAEKPAKSAEASKPAATVAPKTNESAPATDEDAAKVPIARNQVTRLSLHLFDEVVCTCMFCRDRHPDPGS